MQNECCVADLRNKEVINICTGKRLGYVCDVYVDICHGRVLSLVVPYCGNKMFDFVKGKDLVIPWDCIETIGDDLIIVKLEHTAVLEEKEESKDSKRRIFF